MLDNYWSRVDGMSQRPGKISVLVAAYNEEKTISRILGRRMIPLPANEGGAVSTVTEVSLRWLPPQERRQGNVVRSPRTNQHVSPRGEDVLGIKKVTVAGPCRSGHSGCGPVRLPQTENVTLASRRRSFG